MKKITVKTQAEFDALPAKFSEWTRIMFAVCWLLSKKAKITKKSETATIIIPEVKAGTEGWVFFHGSFLLPRLLRRVEDRLWEVRGE